MNRMNRKVEYALMALKHMSQKKPGELTTSKEVVEAVGCPFDATARVLQTMANKGLLKSEQGAHGGYVLIRDLSKVSFYELVEMILGPLAIVKCLHGIESCDLKNSCNILKPTTVLNRKLIDFYKSLPLVELLRSKETQLRPATELGGI